MDQNKKITITTLGSHSALDICRGAKDEDFKTLVVAQKGREKTYKKYYESPLGCVDKCIVVNKFSDILKKDLQNTLTREGSIFIPHRSFEVYLNFDYDAIENKLKVPIFGNKYLLKIEERSHTPNQYDLLKQAQIRIPKQFKNPHSIDRLCLVKVLEKQRSFERAFFLAENYQDFLRESQKRLDQNIFIKKQLDQAIIEEFVLGAQVNLNYFYSAIDKRLEFLGTDTRRQTNLDGLLRIPTLTQSSGLEKVLVSYEEAGHMAVTVLESSLEDIFDMGERFVKASQKLFPPGIIGPFALQTAIIPGPPKKEFVVFDVSPRMPGSPGISATPYSSYLYGYPISMGRRIALEIKKALQKDCLDKIIT